MQVTNRHIIELYSNRLQRHTKILFAPIINQYRLKYAETRFELREAFRLVHDEYRRSGYITNQKPDKMLLNIHHFLSDTSVLLMLFKDKVISTVTMVADTEKFGLPLDSVYQNELNKLRKNSRQLMEGCALATSVSFRGANIVAYLFRQAYHHAVNFGATDICIMVNPKHVQFYKRIFLFEDLGGEKIYPRLQAPAIALRIDVNQYANKLRCVYSDYPAESNLYSFICENKDLTPEAQKLMFDMEKNNGIGKRVTRYFFNALPSDQKKELTEKSDHLKNSGLSVYDL